jgi:exodeoxyribonuclease VII small subunit
MSSDQPTQSQPAPKLDFEAQYQKLLDCVSRLESGQLSLDDALGAYQNGISLVQNCRSILNQAQARVEKLTAIDDNGNIQTEPMNLDVETPDALLGQKKKPPGSSQPF